MAVSRISDLNFGGILGTAYDEATQLLIDTATAARREYDEADRAFRDLEREVEELEKFVNTDFGKGAEIFSYINNKIFMSERSIYF